MVENELISWATDNIVNLLVIFGVMAGVARTIDHRYQQKLDDEVEGLELKHKDDINNLSTTFQGKIDELHRNLNRLDDFVMDRLFPNKRGTRRDVHQ